MTDYDAVPIYCGDGTEFCKAKFDYEKNSIILYTRAREIYYRDLKRQIGNTNFITRKRS